MNLDNLTQEEIRKKAELYEKLRRMNPHEFTELRMKNISSGVAFDELVKRWPENDN